MGNNSTGFRSVRAGLGASQRLDHNDRYTYTRFRGPFTIGDAIGGAFAVADNGLNYISFPGVIFQVMNIGQNDAVQALAAVDNTGMSYTLDSAGNDGFELNLGRGRTKATLVDEYSQGAFTVGTDPAFFVRVKFKINDVSEYDQAAVGFVKGYYIAAGELENESDGYWLNLDNGNVKTESRLNAGSTVATDSTDDVANDTFVTFEIQVNESGVACAFINGARPTTEAAAYTFDDGDVVHADFSAILDASSANLTTFSEWESGFLSSRGIEFGHTTLETGEPAQSYVGV